MTILQERIGEIGVLTLDRPDKRNALSAEMRADLMEALREYLAAPEIRAMVVTGAGGHFCSGGDIQTMQEVSDLGCARERIRKAHEMVRFLAG